MTWMDSHSHHYLSNPSILCELKEKGLEGIVSASWIPVRPSGERQYTTCSYGSSKLKRRG
ncbi:MAG: hypothetical protein JRN53_03225 [Nitrososphaerota archaeon]|nr:hypothetical protein [Nitrososphaerota archaeon]MDG7041774.1 hypothetical protein [Nitrososphaerota archaeon]MDG7046583.1 hypothetical protein [Nitrososphaerota archaeon]